MKHGIKQQRGQTLIEVLVALGAAVVVIAAITAASLSSLKNTEFSRDQAAASHIAQQGLEIIRDMRNYDIASISASLLPDDTYCLADSCKALDSTNPSCWRKNISCGQNVDKFSREIKISHTASVCDATNTGDVEAIVTTSWYDTSCGSVGSLLCHSVVVSSCFSDFTVVPTP